MRWHDHNGRHVMGALVAVLIHRNHFVVCDIRCYPPVTHKHVVNSHCKNSIFNSIYSLFHRKCNTDIRYSVEVQLVLICYNSLVICQKVARHFSDMLWKFQ